LKNKKRDAENMKTEKKKHKLKRKEMTTISFHRNDGSSNWKELKYSFQVSSLVVGTIDGALGDEICIADVG
jgi:hypothetical protein